MKYCKYCGKELTDDSFCDCIEAQLERQRKAKEENQFESSDKVETTDFPNEKDTLSEDYKEEDVSYNDETFEESIEKPTEKIDYNDIKEELLNEEKIDRENTERPSSNFDSKMNFDTDKAKESMNDFKDIVTNLTKKGWNAFIKPYSEGGSLITSLDYKSSFIIYLINGIISSIFAMIYASKANKAVGSIGIFTDKPFPLIKVFFVITISSIVMSVLVALLYYIGTAVFTNTKEMQSSFAIGSLRAIYTIPVKLLAIVLSLFTALGFPIFFLATFLSLPNTISSLFASRRFREDGIPKAATLALILFPLVFLIVASVAAGPLTGGLGAMIEEISQYLENNMFGF